MGLLVVAIAGGGDDGPTTSPSPTSTVTSPLVPASAFPEGTVLQIVSGAGAAPVANAEVVVAGTTYQTNGSGRVTLTTGVNANVNLGITAEGFLERRTLLRDAGETRFTLWPREHENGLSPATSCMEGSTAPYAGRYASTRAFRKPTSCPRNKAGATPAR